MCIVACPYGRLQSVLLDKQSLIVGYDVDARRAARQAQEEAARDRAGRRLRRLRRVRRGVPDRHRHPRRPADGVHRLRAVHRRVRHGDGQARQAARADPLHVPGRARGQAAHAAARAHDRLSGAARDRGRAAGVERRLPRRPPRSSVERTIRPELRRRCPTGAISAQARIKIENQTDEDAPLLDPARRGRRDAELRAPRRCGWSRRASRMEIVAVRRRRAGARSSTASARVRLRINDEPGLRASRRR